MMMTMMMTMMITMMMTTMIIEINSNNNTFRLKGTMPAILSNTLKGQKSHLHQWKLKINGPVVLKVTILSY